MDMTDGSRKRRPYGDVYEDPLVVTGEVKVQRYQYRMFYSMEQNPKMFDTVESGGLPAKLTVENDGTYRISSDYQFKIGSLEDGAPLLVMPNSSSMRTQW